jgi:hypothetical protein
MSCSTSRVWGLTACTNTPDSCNLQTVVPAHCLRACVKCVAAAVVHTCVCGGLGRRACVFVTVCLCVSVFLCVRVACIRCFVWLRRASCLVAVSCHVCVPVLLATRVGTCPGFVVHPHRVALLLLVCTAVCSSKACSTLSLSSLAHCPAWLCCLCVAPWHLQGECSAAAASAAAAVIRAPPMLLLSVCWPARGSCQ